MKQHWRKLGQIYIPKEGGLHHKLISHAANPLPVHLEGDVFRVFYNGRDLQNRSSVGAVDIDIVKRQIVKEHAVPFFEYGPTGSFFADGVSIGNCYESNGVRYMLFMGWQTPKNQHWKGDIGRLIVTPELTLKLESLDPIMSCNSIDPISLSYPWVQANASGNFDMWYGSTITWDAGNGEMLHVIQHANSKDGNQWSRNGLSIPYKLGDAQAFSRPTVAVNQQGFLEMWFSYRGSSGYKYRIGYAKCDNKNNWELDLNNAGITVSALGWDSEMIEYPFVFDHAGSRYMLYNGNGYGKTGFGLAVLDEL